MTTLVTFLLDRSGSMNEGNKRRIAIDSFNKYLTEMSSDPNADILFSRFQFDSISLDTDCLSHPITKVEQLGEHNYQPRGGTPLIDASMKVIKATEDLLAKRIDTPKVIVVFHTDGEENQSNQFTLADLNKAIKEKTEAGWEFMFLGVGLEAYKQALAMGVNANSTMSYNAGNMAESMGKLGMMASNTRDYASGARTSTQYSQEQRLSDAADAQLFQSSGAAASAPTLTEQQLKVLAEANAKPIPPKPVTPAVADVDTSKA